MPPYSAAAIVACLAGLLPILAAHGAYLLNLSGDSTLAAEFVCMPYVDGCVSISRAARSGPGLLLFRVLMLPTALLLLLNWAALHGWLQDRMACNRRRARALVVLGMIGAVFLVLYVTALGSEGEWYRWQRRYGVTFYFGGTALAQLLLVSVLWPQRRSLLDGRVAGPAIALTVLVTLQWVLGVFSSLKRLIFDDPVLIDRVENVIEWWFALAMSLSFIAIAWLFRRSARPPPAGAAGR
jgi:hypothetical protein